MKKLITLISLMFVPLFSNATETFCINNNDIVFQGNLKDSPETQMVLCHYPNFEGEKKYNFYILAGDGHVLSSKSLSNKDIKVSFDNSKNEPFNEILEITVKRADKDMVMDETYTISEGSNEREPREPQWEIAYQTGEGEDTTFFMPIISSSIDFNPTLFDIQKERQ